jgi:serine/threonine protein kinase
MNAIIGFEIIKKLGNGQNGTAFLVKNKNGTHKVVKFVNSPFGQKEHNFQQRASVNRLAPKVHLLKKNLMINIRNLKPGTAEAMFGGGEKKYNAIFMNSLFNDTGTAYSGQNFFQSNKFSRDIKIDVLQKLIRKVGRLHALGIEHGDLNPSNFYIIQKKDGKFSIKFIDFGRSLNRNRNKTTQQLKNEKYYGNSNRNAYSPLLVYTKNGVRRTLNNNATNLMKTMMMQ